MISAWTRETSAPASRKSVSLRRPIEKTGLSIGTMRRPSASVTTRRGFIPDKAAAVVMMVETRWYSDRRHENSQLPFRHSSGVVPRTRVEGRRRDGRDQRPVLDRDDRRVGLR